MAKPWIMAIEIIYYWRSSLYGNSAKFKPVLRAWTLLAVKYISGLGRTGSSSGIFTRKNPNQKYVFNRTIKISTGHCTLVSLLIKTANSQPHVRILHAKIVKS